MGCNPVGARPDTVWTYGARPQCPPPTQAEKDAWTVWHRFAPYFFETGDPYQSPNAPYFVAAYNISSASTAPPVDVEQTQRLQIPTIP